MDKPERLKAIIYLGALSIDGFSVSDAVVYSQIVYRSISDGGADAFSKEGKLDLAGYADLEWMVPLSLMAQVEFYEDIGLSRSQYFRSLANLRYCGYLTDKAVYLDKDACSRFISLYPIRGLSGHALVVYSYVRHYTRRYKKLDKLHSNMAKELGMSEAGLSKCLGRLASWGLIRFERDGRRLYLVAR